jgi:hypothetical protein
MKHIKHFSEISESKKIKLPKKELSDLDSDELNDIIQKHIVGAKVIGHFGNTDDIHCTIAGAEPDGSSGSGFTVWLRPDDQKKQWLVKMNKGGKKEYWKQNFVASKLIQAYQSGKFTMVTTGGGLGGGMEDKYLKFI